MIDMFKFKGTAKILTWSIHYLNLNNSWHYDFERRGQYLVQCPYNVQFDTLNVTATKYDRDLPKTRDG